MTNFIAAEVDRYVYWIEERERIRHLKEEVQENSLLEKKLKNAVKINSLKLC